MLALRDCELLAHVRSMNWNPINHDINRSFVLQWCPPPFRLVLIIFECFIGLGVAVYSRFGLAGGLCSTLSHTAAVPLDVVKTLMQTSPGLFSSTWDGLVTVARSQGFAGLYRGAGPTAAGRSQVPRQCLKMIAMLDV